MIIICSERPRKLSVSGHRGSDDKNTFAVLADDTGHGFRSRGM